jgi:Holliday junction resolvase RusA-like endonuclease
MNGRSVSFTVPGDPIPQPRARTRVCGAFATTYTPDNGIRPYKSAIQLAAAVAGAARLHGTVVVVTVEAVFVRPPSHFLASGKVRKGAPPIPMRADWDNLAKGVCDAIFGDDRYISEGRCRKRYAQPGETAHTRVTITEDPDHAPAVTDAAVNV